MGGLDKYWSVTMTNTVYESLVPLVRVSFLSEKVFYKDYEEYKDDAQFMMLYRNFKKAKKALEDYKYNKRHSDS